MSFSWILKSLQGTFPRMSDLLVAGCSLLGVSPLESNIDIRASSSGADGHERATW